MNEIYNHKLSYRLPCGQKKEDGTTCSVRSSALLTKTF